MSKFQIGVVDFMCEVGKHPIGEKDCNGVGLCVGDIIEYNGQKHMIAYRYRFFVLKMPMTAHTLEIEDWNKTTKLDEMWSTPDYIACGDTEDDFYKEVKHLFPEDKA